MEKVILVMDRPENCDKCRICATVENEDYCAYLGARDGQFIYQNGYAELSIGMSNCPLRSMPRDMTMENMENCDYDKGFVNGFNFGIQLISLGVKNNAYKIWGGE